MPTIQEQLISLGLAVDSRKPTGTHKGKRVFLKTTKAPAIKEVGTMGKYHPSKIPNGRVSNSAWVGLYSKIYGVNQRPFRDPMTPVRHKKIGELL